MHIIVVAPVHACLWLHDYILCIILQALNVLRQLHRGFCTIVLHLSGNETGDSGVWDLMKAHNFSIGLDPDHPVRQDGALQGFVHLLAGWKSDQELTWLALVVKSSVPPKTR